MALASYQRLHHVFFTPHYKYVSVFQEQFDFRHKLSIPEVQAACYSTKRRDHCEEAILLVQRLEILQYQVPVINQHVPNTRIRGSSRWHRGSVTVQHVICLIHRQELLLSKASNNMHV
jgi:hypothetical protein